MAVISTVGATTTPIPGNKISVLDAVIVRGREDLPLIGAIGKGAPVWATTHSWINDNIAEPENIDNVEIAPMASSPASTKYATSNQVEIFKNSYGVSFDENKIRVYGDKNELGHQRWMRMKKHGLDQEFRVLGLGRNADPKISVFLPPVERASAIAGKMAGVYYFMAKGETAFTPQNGLNRRGNVIAYDSAGDWTGTPTALTIDMLDQLVGIPYDKGARVTDLFMGRTMKAKCATLFDRFWKNEKYYNHTVDTIELTCGKVRLHLHHMMEAYGLKDTIIACDPAYGSYRPLEERVDDIALTETAIQKQFYTSATLQIKNPEAWSAIVGVE